MSADLLNLWGDCELSPLAEAVARRQAQGLDVQDFVTSNPYDHGFRFDPGLLAEILAQAGAAAGRYGADPLGRRDARQAVCQWHTPAAGPAADQVLLTPGTSMAYFYLFRLLASGGDILCPAPTYPLFDDLAKIAGARVRFYHLSRTGMVDGTVRWTVDPEEIAFQVTPQTRAIVIVSPHNPTGTVASPEELQLICRTANRAGAAVILDEVFKSYALDSDSAQPTPQLHEAGADLAFTLNGISKSHYLPGWKAGWIVAEGTHNSRVRQAVSALEYMSDSFLPVSEVTQAALPALLTGHGRQEAARLSALQKARFHQTFAAATAYGWTIDRPQSGPYLCARLPENTDATRAALNLLENTGALLHPGDFYRLPGYMVGTIYNSAPWPPLQQF